MKKLRLCILYIGLLLALYWMLPGVASALPADTTGFSISLVRSPDLVSSPTLASSPANRPTTVSIISKTTTNIRLEWLVLLNGQPGQKGAIPALYLSPRHATLARLPLRLPGGTEEAWLRITCRRPGAPHNADPLTTTLLLLRPWQGPGSIPAAGELAFNDSNSIFTITTPNSLIQFDKQTGWLLHYETGKTPLIADTTGLQPTLWPNTQPRLQLFSTSTGTQLVIVRAEYTIPETWSLLHLSYTINAAGEMLVGEVLEPDTSQHLPDSVHRPALSRFGMRWLLPHPPDSIGYYGSADTSVPPDIVHLPSPVTGLRENTTAGRHFTDASRGDVAPYIRWFSVNGPGPTGLRITADSNLLHIHPIPPAASTTYPQTEIDIDAPTHSPDGGQYTFKVTPVLPPPPTPAPQKPTAPNKAAPSGRSATPIRQKDR